MHGSYGGFDYAAREARRELLEEARTWHLAKLARRSRQGLRERVARLVARVWGSFRPAVAGDGGPDADGAPDIGYLVTEDSGEDLIAVEVHLGDGGCVVRRTDLLTGSTTDAFVEEAPFRP